MAAKSESKLERTVKDIAGDVKKMREILYDVGMKLTYVIERRFDYMTAPQGLMYDEEYIESIIDNE